MCPRTGPASAREDFGSKLFRMDAGAFAPALALAAEGVAAPREALFALRVFAPAAGVPKVGLPDLFVMVRSASACEPRLFVTRNVRSPGVLRIARSLFCAAVPSSQRCGTCSLPIKFDRIANGLAIRHRRHVGYASLINREDDDARPCLNIQPGTRLDAESVNP